MAKKKRHLQALYFADVAVVATDRILMASNWYTLECKDEEKAAIISLKDADCGGTNLQNKLHAIRNYHQTRGDQLP